jgi:orotate phosphoribosyltransferase
MVREMYSQHLHAFTDTATCYEFRDEFLTTYGRISPYVFRTPTPFTGPQLRAVGVVGAQLVQKHTDSSNVHVVGVARRGIPLATAIAVELTNHGVDSVLSVLGRDGSLDLITTLFDREELDRNGADVRSELAANFRCEAASIFTIRDLISSMPAGVEHNTLSAYASEFGTESLRQYMSKPD